MATKLSEAQIEVCRQLYMKAEKASTPDIRKLKQLKAVECDCGYWVLTPLGLSIVLDHLTEV